jgi:Zn finger protein HypA/HybF involved in hydrogenase expression
MHEFAATQSLVQATLDHLKHRGVKKVLALRLRRGSTFSEDALRAAYAAVSAGTLLEQAELSVETVNLTFHCPCGHTQIVMNDDLIGHMFVCPRCDTTQEVDEAHDLEVVEVLVETEEAHHHEKIMKQE